VRTLDDSTIEIAAPGRLGDRTARDAIELGRLELRMDVEGDPFEEPDL